jgi:hypothetical protein
MRGGRASLLGLKHKLASHPMTDNRSFKQAERDNVIANGLDPDVWCADRPSIPTGAFEKCSAAIEDAFRPDRKARHQIVSQGHHVHALVEGKRYGFAEACRLMEVDVRLVAQAMQWLEQDNSRMNAKFGGRLHHLRGYDYELLQWMNIQTAALPSAEVVSIHGGGK